MSIAIQIDDELYVMAQNIAKDEQRSVDEQIAFWARLGKTALDNPDLPIDFIMLQTSRTRVSRTVCTCQFNQHD